MATFECAFFFGTIHFFDVSYDILPGMIYVFKFENKFVVIIGKFNIFIKLKN